MTTKDKVKKYSIHSYQSGTTWVKSTSGLNLHCGYWLNGNLQKLNLLKQRGSHERDKFVYALVDCLNNMDEADGYKPYVWISCIDYVKSMTRIVFDDPILGKLELSNKKVSHLAWEEEPIPEDFLDDLSKLCERVRECDKED